MNKTLLLKPRMSEQAYALAKQGRGYVFLVPTHANKQSVARAVEAQFEVNVTSVNIANVVGKRKRTLSITGKRAGRPGVRTNTKKAYVRLAKDQVLPIYAAVEEETEQEEKTQAQVAKMVEKQSKKESKLARRGLNLLRKKEDNA